MALFLRWRIAWMLALITATGAVFAPTVWLAAPAAAALLILPGLVLIERLSSVRTTPGRYWLGVAAGITLAPVALDLLWRFSNDRTAILITLVVLALALWFLPRRDDPTAPVTDRSATMFENRGGAFLFTAMMIWVAGCVFAAYWLPEAGDRFAVRAAHDYVKHHAILFSLDQHTLPIRSAFYASGSDDAYYYYHFHYLLAAALRKLAGDSVSLGFAFGVTSALLAATLMAVVYLLARGVCRSQSAALLAAACVSIIGGWDALFVWADYLAGKPLAAISDAWAPSPWRLHNIGTQFTWCPQHVAALVAVTWAAILFRRAPDAAWWIALAPLTAAAVFGESVYMAMTIFPAAIVVIFTRIVAWRRTRGAMIRGGMSILCMLAIGTIMLPVAQGYRVMSERMPGGFTMQWERFPRALFGRAAPPGVLANWLDAPWILLVDFGLPAASLLLVTGAFRRRLWTDPGLRLLTLAGGLGVLGAFTVHSSLHDYVYGFRVSVMPLNVALACCAGALLVPELCAIRSRRLALTIVAIGAAIGLPVGAIEMPFMASRSLIQRNPFADDVGAIRFLRNRTPPGAVVQGDPDGRESLLQLVERPMGVLNPDNPHAQVFAPPDLDLMRETYESVLEAWRTQSPQTAYRCMRGARVEFVLVGTVETQRFGAAAQFDEPVYFERVYRDEHARVYRVRSTPLSPDAANGALP